MIFFKNVINGIKDLITSQSTMKNIRKLKLSQHKPLKIKIDTNFHDNGMPKEGS